MRSILTNYIERCRTLPNSARMFLAGSNLNWIHWLVVLGSLVLTFFSWHYLSSDKEARIQGQFERESDRVIDLVNERMRKYEDALWSGVALIKTSDDDIDFETWQRYADNINIEEKYPGINGIGVIHSVPAGELDSYLAKQRVHRPDFRVHPKHAVAESLPITYVIPVEGNEAAVGLDMAHEINRYTAAQKARDLGVLQITGPITLVQDTDKTPGFLFFAPFYKSSVDKGGIASSIVERRSKFAGMVYAPFVVKKLMEGTVGKDKRWVGIRIRDGGEVLYDELQVGEPDFDPNPMFTETVDVQLFGRNWKFDIWTAKSFRHATADNQPLTILIGGIILDGLIVLLFLSMTRDSKKWLGIADSVSVQLDKKSKALEQKAAELEGRNEQLRRFNGSAVGRELLMVGLKHEVNELLEKNGESRRYSLLTTSAEELSAAKDQQIVLESFEMETEQKELVSKVAELESMQLATLNMMEDAEHARQTLVAMNESLQQKNKDLEQFAFIASHDLQEPLRKVASFCSLLQSEYGERLDDDGRQYLSFAIDGATRMRSLVQDLLTFSKIGSQFEDRSVIDTHAALEVAGLNLELLISESDAKVTCDDLPSVFAQPREITQLFQNLIGNSIKYRSKECPEIHISSIDSGNCWQFLVSDNGIGIEPEYQEQIFGIFKRLHSRNEYSGTGIGLAICKRIVEQLGGKIWIKPKVKPGCCICFTIPKNSAKDVGHPTLKTPLSKRRKYEHVAIK